MRRLTCKKLQVQKRPKERVKKYVLCEKALTEYDAELIRELHEEFGRGASYYRNPEHWGYARLAAKFGVSKSTVLRICRYMTYR